MRYAKLMTDKVTRLVTVNLGNKQQKEETILSLVVDFFTTIDAINHLERTEFVLDNEAVSKYQILKPFESLFWRKAYTMVSGPRYKDLLDRSLHYGNSEEDSQGKTYEGKVLRPGEFKLIQIELLGWLKIIPTDEMFTCYDDSETLIANFDDGAYSWNGKVVTDGTNLPIPLTVPIFSDRYYRVPVDEVLVNDWLDRACEKLKVKSVK